MYYEQFKKLSGGRGESPQMHPRKCANARRAASRKSPTQPPKVPVQRRAGRGWQLRARAKGGQGVGTKRKKRVSNWQVKFGGSRGGSGMAPEVRSKPQSTAARSQFPNARFGKEREGGRGGGGGGRDQRGVSLAGWRAGRKSPMHPPKVQIHRRAASRKCKYIGGREGGESFLNCS